MTRKWSKFVSVRTIDGKQRDVIVDICGEVIKDNPTDEELKGLMSYVRLRTRDILKLQESDKKEYLLEFLRQFHRKERRVPKEIDFRNNLKYPSSKTYQRVFGSWNNAIKLAGLEVNHPKKIRLYTDEELLKYLIQFYEENGRAPTEVDFIIGDYPDPTTYKRRFGSWNNALKLVGLDIDSMTKKGIIDTNRQKGRLAEIFVRDHFAKKDKVIDLSGKNCNSPFDGICPKGQNYDVKGAKLYIAYGWDFHLGNMNKYEIEWYYLLAFNEDWTELLHVWRIPSWDIVKNIEQGRLWISTNQIENMIQYEITDRFIPMFEIWLNKKKEGITMYDKRQYDGAMVQKN